jgi:hypothetical protein
MAASTDRCLLTFIVLSPEKAAARTFTRGQRVCRGVTNCLPATPCILVGQLPFYESKFVADIARLPRVFRWLGFHPLKNPPYFAGSILARTPVCTRKLQSLTQFDK